VRKILFSLMTLVLVVGMVGGGAFAYFSDYETSTGNTFTAGTIDIDVDGQNPWTRVDFVIAPTAKPCEDYFDTMTITNVGNNDLELWKHIGDLVCAGGLNPEPEQEQEASTGVNDNLAAVVDYDLEVDGVIVIPKGSQTLADRDCVWIHLGTLVPDQVMTVVQSYHIMADAGNEYQGDTCSFTVEFYAEQLGGPGKP